MGLLRHGTKDNSHVLESLIIIYLRNYILITDSLSDLHQSFRVRPIRVLYQTWGHTHYRLDGRSVQHDSHLQKSGTSADAVLLVLFGLW